MLAAAGVRVAIAGRNRARLEAVARGNITAHPCDVTDKAQVQDLVNSVSERFGRIDVLVNNAGLNSRNRAIKDLDPETWDRLIRVNLDGTFYVTHAVLPGMRARRDGLIVNISSVVGKRANPLGGAAYNAAKFGMSALGLTLSVEMKDENIRVTNIYPGEVDTGFLDYRPQAVTDEHRSRILHPNDVAAAVLFICTLPPRAHVPELIIKPTSQVYF
jgi:NADP-dependent 3-hydroxy acid dehydrogenase YdfG